MEVCAFSFEVFGAILLLSSLGDFSEFFESSPGHLKLHRVFRVKVFNAQRFPSQFIKRQSPKNRQLVSILKRTPHPLPTPNKKPHKTPPPFQERFGLVA
jgi:hypothetical protein